MVSWRNEDVSAESFIYLNDMNNEEPKQDNIGKYTDFKAVVTRTKNNFFHQSIIEFSNWLDLNDHKYQTYNISGETN